MAGDLKAIQVFTIRAATVLLTSTMYEIKALTARDFCIIHSHTSASLRAAFRGTIPCLSTLPTGCP